MSVFCLFFCRDNEPIIGTRERKGEEATQLFDAHTLSHIDSVTSTNNKNNNNNEPQKLQSAFNIFVPLLL